MKRQVYKALMATGLFALLWLSQAAALEIVYPADKTWFPRSDFLILKGGNNPPLEGMTVEINGVRSDPIDISGADYKAAFADFLILQPEFDRGKNKVVVDGYAGGQKVTTASAEIFYVDGDPTVVPPAGFAPFRMHLPEKEKLCAPCHNMTPSKAELSAETEQANPCASCHRRMLAKEYVHGPAGVYRCTFCHESDSRPGKYAVRTKDGELCTQCHQEKVEKFKKNKFVHGPVAANLCLLCHDAHASDHPAQLTTQVNRLCIGCHEDIPEQLHVVRGVGGSSHPLEGVPDPSGYSKTLSCASCHDPHGGEVGALFRYGFTSSFELCQKCHQK